jgi:hypothetical protein
MIAKQSSWNMFAKTCKGVHHLSKTEAADSEKPGRIETKARPWDRLLAGDWDELGNATSLTLCVYCWGDPELHVVCSMDFVCFYLSSLHPKIWRILNPIALMQIRTNSNNIKH